jgi:hypothetical protein
VSLRFLDSFDHYVTADLTEKWTTNSAAAISAGSGRRGTAALLIASSTYVEKTLDAQATWIVGCSYRCTGLPAILRSLIAVLDAGSIQAQLMLAADGTLQVTRAGNALTDGASTFALAVGTTYYLEFKVTIANSIAANSCQVRVDGTVVLTVAAGQDTQVTANASGNQIRCGPGSSTSGASWYYDDLYICDGTGGVNADFLGDCRVDCLFPNGDGANSAWTPSSGTTHSTLVDESAPNDDTDYLASSTASARETHTLGNLASMTLPLVRGVQHSLSMKKDDAGTRQAKSLLKSGATTQVGSTTHTLSTSYAFYTQMYDTDPNTGAAWTTSAIDALEAGVEAV